MELKEMKEKIEEVNEDRIRKGEQLKTLKAKRKELESDLKDLGVESFEQIEEKEKGLKKELNKQFKKLNETETEVLIEDEEKAEEEKKEEEIDDDDPGELPDDDDILKELDLE